MLTHFGDFLCSIGGKNPFKTGFSLWRAALAGVFYDSFFSAFSGSTTMSL
jgi:hypothetical protein